MTSNCIISNTSFLNDIIDLDKKLLSNDTTSRIADLYDLISRNDPNTTNWSPLFISPINSKIDNDLISNHGYYENDTLGMQNFIKINNPNFHSWIATNAYMSTDWTLNKSYMPYVACRGLLLWYKSITPPPVSDGGSEFGDTLLDNNGNLKLIRNRNEIDNPDLSYMLWIPDGDVFEYYINGSEKLNHERLNIPPRTFCSASLYKYYKIIYHLLTINNSKSFNYRNTKTSRIYKLISKYLSTSPFIDEDSINYLSSSSSYRGFGSITNYINTYINNPSINGISALLINISKELESSLPNTIDSFSPNNRQSEIRPNLSNNLCLKKIDLFKKIISKYGSFLTLGSGNNNYSSILYIPQLPHGASVAITQVGTQWCKKLLSNNTTVIANQNIKLGGLSIESDFTDKKSHIVLQKDATSTNDVVQTQKVYLYNAVKPLVKNLNINVILNKSTNSTNPLPDEIDNPNIFYWYANTDAPLIELSLKLEYNKTTYKAAEDTFKSSDMFIEENYVNCTWEQASGPPMKFININKLAQNAPINTSLGSGDNVKYGENSFIGNTAYIFPSSTGRYQIKCNISTLYGNFTIIKTFYIVMGGSFNPRNGTSVKFPDNFYGKYIDSKLNYNSFSNNIFPSLDTPNINTYLQTPDLTNTYKSRILSLQNTRNIRINVPEFRKIAVHRNGLFWPIDSNLMVHQKNVRSSSFHQLTGDTFKFNFVSGVSLPNNTPGTVYIQYRSENAILKLDSIILENIRNNTDPKCKDCLSMYYPKLIGRDSIDFIREGDNITKAPSVTYARAGFGEGAYLLEAYDVAGDEVINIGPKIYSLPEISTDFSPTIQPYGGYDTNIQNSIGFNIPGHPSSFQAITGYKMDYQTDNSDSNNPTYKQCIEKTIQNNKSIVFSKGVFHPNSGWIPYDSPLYNSTKNLSSVLKFNPGARDSFSFVGPSINNLINDGFTTIDGIEYIIPREFSSSVKLSISEGARWIPFCRGCNDPPNVQPPEWKWKNQFHTEYADQQPPSISAHTHGYRILEGGTPKPSEKLLTSSKDQTMDEFGTETINGRLYKTKLINEISYRFPVNGPAYPITNTPQDVITAVTGNNGGAETTTDLTTISWPGLRDPRVLEFKIQDIELKLNFLNYVNTKDLSISLEMEQSAEEKDRVAGSERANNPFKNISKFDEQHIPININKSWIHNSILTNDGLTPISSLSVLKNPFVTRYLTNLIDMNSFTSSDSNINLHLLNQEYIQNNNYNFSLTFTDSANKFNVLNDYSLINTSGINLQQNIIQNNQTIKPTIAATGFSDSDCALFHNIMLSNKLYVTNNTFNKFQNQRLFKEPAPPCPEGGRISEPRYTGKSTFICNIKIFDEHDDMSPIDNIYDAQLFTNFYSFDKQINSSKFTNSLCNWELFLHVGRIHKPTTSLVNSMNSYSNSDSLSLIEYGSKPRFPGYSFIADLTNKKYLLPFINLNAPYAFFQASNLCEDPANESVGKSLIKVTPRFPTEIIVAIIASTAAISGAGGLVGVLGALGPYTIASNLLYKGLIDSFLQTQLLETREATRRNIYQPTYDNYPFGSPEKILINFSKDNLFWYKAEASIFRYHHTPALIPNTYNYMKLSSNICPSLANFNIDFIQSIRDIVDPILIKTLSINCPTSDSPQQNTLSGLSIVDSTGNTQVFQENDIIDVIFNQPVNTDNSNSYCTNGLYIATSNEWIAIETDPTALSLSTKFIQFNSILNYNNNNSFLALFNTYKFNSVFGSTIVKIDGDLVHKLVSAGDTINMVDDKNILGTNFVKAKALIYIDNKPYTLLILKNRVVGTSISVNNCIILFRSQNSFDKEVSINGSSFAPLSNSFCQKENINFIEQPEVMKTTNSMGSYGDGSSSKNKDIFYLNNIQNKLQRINEIFNNLYSDTIKYNQVIANGLNLTSTNGSCGYESRLNSIPSVINNLQKYISSSSSITNSSGIFIQEVDEQEKNTINNIITDYNGLVYNNTSLNPSIIYLTNINTNNISNFGQVSVQEDYAIKNNVMAVTENEQPITATSKEFTDLVSRINQIDDVSIDTTIDTYIGKPQFTDNIIFTKKLKYIYEHYNNLDDNSIIGIEAKKKTEYAIRVFSKEKNDIIKLLNLVCDKQYVTINFKNTREPIVRALVYIENLDFISLLDGRFIKKDDNILNIIRSYDFIDISNKILPQTIATVKFIPNIFTASNLNSINVADIDYKDNNNYYWINLDPNQCCSIAEELRPRVLKSIKYICNRVNLNAGGAASLTNQPSNNICARFAKDSQTGDIVFSKSGTEYKYTVSQESINQKKTEIENKAGNMQIVWTTQYVERRYQINPTETIDKFFENNELLITAIEEYEVLSAPYEISNVTTGRDADAAQLPGMGTSPCPDKSPAGFGLLTNRGLSRTGMSLKIYNVCNLDDTNNLSVQVRKIPRQIRGVDLLSTINRYANPDTYRPKLGGSLLDPLDATTPQILNNNFYYWACYENVGDTLIQTIPPPFFQLMNEMMYRSFYGSVDRIENKYDELVSQFLWEIIPHEFYTLPPPQQS